MLEPVQGQETTAIVQMGGWVGGGGVTKAQMRVSPVGSERWLESGDVPEVADLVTCDWEDRIQDDTQLADLWGWGDG